MAAEPHFASVDPAHDDPFDPDAAPLAARFCLFHPPAGPLRGLVLQAHAFGEEMNKSRRMAALQSRALAAAGFAVLQLDLLGCGDSAGDFGDATWARWCADLRWAAAQLRHRSGAANAPLWLWGHRVGALLAAQVAGELAAEAAATPGSPPPNLLLWQPTGLGKAALQQFLRLKAAAAMLDGGGKGVVDGLKRELAAGRHVDVAGYALHPALATGLEAATLTPPAGNPPGRLVWLELASPSASTSTPADSAAPALLPASALAVEKWRAAGWQVQARAVAGPAFWQTTEIEDAPALVAATTQALLEAAA